jgi:hypothetical protein
MPRASTFLAGLHEMADSAQYSAPRKLPALVTAPLAAYQPQDLKPSPTSRLDEVVVAQFAAIPGSQLDEEG